MVVKLIEERILTTDETISMKKIGPLACGTQSIFSIHTEHKSYGFWICLGGPEGDPDDPLVVSDPPCVGWTLAKFEAWVAMVQISFEKYDQINKGSSS